MRRVLALSIALLAACGPATPAVKTVSLRMTGTPPDARVTIDDQRLGPLSFIAAHGVALPPGQHRVTVEAPGYFPSDQLVDAQPGQGPIRLQISLVAIPE